MQQLKNTYLALEKAKRPVDQNYAVYAYFLLERTVDGLHGYHIHLGNFATRERAAERVQELINITGHQQIYAHDVTRWERIDEVIRHDRIFIKAHDDPNRKQTEDDLNKQYASDLKDEDGRIKKNKEIGRQLDEQQELEGKDDTIEHYAQNWFLAIKNKAEYEYHRDRMEHFHKMYVMRKDIIKTQYSAQPHFEEEWLPLYKDRLTYRGEGNVYQAMESGHAQLVEDILGIKHTDA